MKTIFVSVKLIMLNVLQISYVYGGNIPLNKKTMITTPRKGFRLEGNIIKELKSLSMITCNQKCLHDFTCHSTNVQIINADSLPVVNICQLMSDNLKSKGNALVKSPGWIYNDLKVSNVLEFLKTLPIFMLKFDKNFSIDFLC